MLWEREGIGRDGLVGVGGAERERESGYSGKSVEESVFRSASRMDAPAKGHGHVRFGR